MRTVNRSMLSNVSGRRQASASRPSTTARLLAVVCAALLYSLSAVPLAFGQTTGSATLRVTVKDPQGAIVTNANVTVTSARTGEQRSATTSDEGTTTFASLLPGAYTVRVESTNFKAFEQRVELNANDTRGVDATLEVGSPTETVTVTAAAEQQIQTETGARESTITARQIENLSIVGRSALELLRTQPGVAAPNPDDPGFQSVGFNSGANANNQYNVNGLRGENNNVTIDGSRVIDIGSNNGTIITANADMVQEVKIQSSNYAAEYGSSGVQLTATTKGGGREFHGTVYDYIRHHKLNANDRSRSLFGIPRAQDKYHYPGGNISGPVCLPNFGEGGPAGRCYRDRLFFFFGFEVQRQTVDPGAVFARVPTEEQRQGRGFTHQFTGQSFNLTPAQIDPIGQALINLYPRPNFNNPTGARNNANYVFSGLQPINRTQGTLRFDYKVTDRTNAYLRLARESETQEYARGLWWNPSAYELPSHVQGSNLGRSASLNVTSVLSPTMTNEVVFSASKLQLNNDYKEPEKVSLASLGLQNLRGPLGQLSPYAPIALITSWGNPNIADFWEPGNLPLFAHNSSFSVTDNLTKVVGAHTMKFGGLIEQGNKFQNFQASPEGLLIYAPWSGNSTGDVFADILAGRVAQFNQSTTVPSGKFRFYNIEGYAQDSWKVRPNFTLEYGVRLAYFPHNKELEGRGVIFDPRAYNPSQGLFIGGDINRPNGILYAGRGEIPKGLLENPAVRFAPRLNFAWDIFGNASTVIRGGAGLFYNRVQGNYEYYSLQQPPNAFGGGCGGQCGIGFGAGGYTRPQVSLAGLASAAASTGIELTSRNPESNKIPRITSMSLSIARRLPLQNVLEVAYVGTLGRFLPNQRNINYIPVGRLLSGTVGNANLSDPVQRWAVTSANAGLLNQFRPFPAYGNITFREFAATSAYHALQATLSRQLASRFTYFATYTFSKALGITGISETGDLIDPIDARGRSYGILPYDRTHIFNLSYNWNLPDLARGSFRNWLTRGALNGWQVSGITTIQSGNPMRLRFFGDLASGSAAVSFFGTNAFTSSAANAGAIAPIFTRNPIVGNSGFGERYLDLGAIQIPGFGSSGATIAPFYIRAPGRSNFDVTLMKNFNFTEERRIQFRAGFFNIFNQAFPRYQQTSADVFNDISQQLNTVCNVRVNNVPNGAGTSNDVCDPRGGFSFTQDTLNNFGRITSKHGHRVVELALKFYF